jgi:glutathione S-transferase
MMGFGNDPEDMLAQAKQKTEVVFKFYAEKLGDGPFFCGDRLTLADVVAGTFAPWFEGLGLPMSDYPTLQTWTNRLMERPSWQTTQPTAKDLAAFRDRMQQRMAAQGQ